MSLSLLLKIKELTSMIDELKGGSWILKPAKDSYRQEWEVFKFLNHVHTVRFFIWWTLLGDRISHEMRSELIHFLVFHQVE